MPKKIWVFAFEYAGIAKVGGLGEVSANQCRNLAGEPELDLQVFMPSHGIHRDLKEKLNLSPLTQNNGKKMVIKSRFDPLYFGFGLNKEPIAKSSTDSQTITSKGYFEVEIWRGNLDGVTINLLVGITPLAATILNDVEVYGASTLNAKMGLFSLTMREYMRQCINLNPSAIPAIIHIHDHHPVCALLCCQQELNLVGRRVNSIITMHLLTWPRRNLEFFWKSGVNNEKMNVILGKYPSRKNIEEVFFIAKEDEYADPTLEKIGCIIADKVIAVSENFLHSDIIPNCGGDLIKWKSDFTWNGCDWDFARHHSIVYNQVSHYLNGLTESEISSWEFRKLLLTQVIGDLAAGEPKIPGKELREVIRKEFTDPPYRSDCTVDAFSEDGPMVLITGRVSPQKGIETIFEALPHVITHLPNTKFVFLMVPTPYTVEDLQNYMVVARKYPNNVRFIFGISGSIFLLSHLAADVYCCPSRWEPFGIVALEAMASKLPVIATHTGGLIESILHVEDHPEKGTGILVPVDDFEALGQALVSFLNTMEIAREKTMNPQLTAADVAGRINTIRYPTFRSRVEQNLLYGLQLRKNALDRVESTFRWKIVSKKLKEIYLQLND